MPNEMSMGRCGLVPVVEVMTHRILDMSETISAKLFAAKPSGDHDDMVLQTIPFQHANDHHPGTGFTVVILDWA